MYRNRDCVLAVIDCVLAVIDDDETSNDKTNSETSRPGCELGSISNSPRISSTRAASAHRALLQLRIPNCRAVREARQRAAPRKCPGFLVQSPGHVSILPADGACSAHHCPFTVHV